MEFDRAVAELQTLVETLERDGDERALHLLDLIDAIHRPAMELIAAGRLEHPVVQAVLGMYSPDPLDDEMAAEEALDHVRSYIESHGGELELLRVEEGVVHVRLSGACVGCAGSAITLRRGVEEALREHMPGFREMVAHEPEAAPGPQLLQIAPMRRPQFVDAGPEEELADGAVRAMDADGVSVLLARVGDEVYALRNGCAADGLPLEGSRLTDEGVLVCPWHNCAYDVRTGRRVDGGEGRLGVVPVALRDGHVQVAVNVA